MILKRGSFMSSFVNYPPAIILKSGFYRLRFIIFISSSHFFKNLPDAMNIEVTKKYPTTPKMISICSLDSDW